MDATTRETLPWLALLLLGALHGVNPGMGWLFAVALGLQERSRRAVWGALAPLAAGHAAAMAAALALGTVLGATMPARPLRWLVAASLAAVGVRALVRHSHGRWIGMRVNARELATWSCLVATAHGAGLMALPLLLDRAPSAHAHHGATAMGIGAGVAGMPLLAALVHAVGYLLVTGIVAVVVYERVGLRLLRTAWINLDALWAAALIGTAVFTVVR